MRKAKTDTTANLGLSMDFTTKTVTPSAASEAGSRAKTKSVLNPRL